MKKKLSKIMGIGFALVLVASLMLFAVPASAGSYPPLQPTLPNLWTGFPPTPGMLGAWFYDPAISQVGPLAQAINGDFYAYVAGTAATPNNPGTNDIFKSTDGGRTWTVSTIPFYYFNTLPNVNAPGGAVVDMVCSSMSEDILYLTDGNYVYRSINGGLTFDLVAAEDLETELTGTCGTAVHDFPITSIDLAYDGAGTPIVFIGTKYVGENYDDSDGYPIAGSVYWIADQTFSADWKDLQLRCYGCCDWPNDDPPVGCYDVFAVAGAPDFANQNKAYAIVSAPLTSITFAGFSGTIEIRAGDGDGIGTAGSGGEFDWSALAGVSSAYTSGTDLDPYEVVTLTASSATGVVNITNVDGTISWRVATATAGTATFCGGTYAVRTLGTVCAWSTVSELKWNCMWSFNILHSSRIMFPSYFATEPTLFAGVTAYEDTAGSFQGFGEGGDVYRVADTLPIPSGCIDLNVQGFMTGCLGLRHANICSLDIENDQLVAGAWDSYQLQSPNRVYYSADGGWTWAPSLKDPTGTLRTWVLFGGSIVAGTAGCNAAFSLDCGPNPGQFFNQISLIDMNIDQVLDLTHSPGYSVDSSTVFVLTYDETGCSPGPDHNLLRFDGTYWERVHTSDIFDPLNQVWLTTPMYDWVEVAPDFNSTGCVYMANTGFYMTRSLDAGCSWTSLIYPCLERPTISAWIVVDEETVLAAGGGASAGNVYRTINHGSQPWSIFPVTAFPAGYASQGVDFDLSLPRGVDSDVLLGDDNGQVFISQDLGATWAEICDVVLNAPFESAHNTYVVFDPGYGTADDPGENMIYAAAGTSVGRCDLNFAAPMFTQDWVYISSTGASCDPFTMQLATGIDAHGDTVLYVSDLGSYSAGSTVTTIAGTIGVRYTCADPTLCTCDLTIAPPDVVTLTLIEGTFQLNEPVNIIEYNLYCDTGDSILGDFWVQGLISGAIGKLATVNEDETDGTGCGACTVDFGAVEILYSSLQVTAAPTASVDHPTGVWRTLNPMDLMPPVFPLPLVEWEFLPENATGPNMLIHPEAGLAGALGVYPDDLWLTVTANSNVLWALDDDGEYSPTSYIWMWDDPLARPVIQVQPADGVLLATTTTVTLEWQPLDAATLYQVYIYSFCETCPDNMVVFDNFTTALTCIVVEGLTPGTTYFWKVRVACDSPFVSKWSDLRSFDTALGAVPYLCAPWCGQDDVILTTNFAWDPVVGATSYEIQIVAANDEGLADWTGVTTYTSVENAFASIPGLEYSTVYYWRVRSVKDGIYSAWAVCLFTTMDAPVEPPEPPPAVVVTQTEITPVWIWVIIGIGGALTIAVVILIVTTRKVP